MMEKISPLKILPDKTKHGFKIHSEVNGIFLKTWYILPSNKRKINFTFPRYLRINENFMCSLGLSVGEGLNNPNLRNIHYNFSNTNIELVKKVYSWLIKDLGVPKKSIQIYVNIPKKEFNKDKIIDQIKSKFKISNEDIKYYFKDRNKKVSVMIQVCNSIFQSFYLNLFKILEKEIIKSKNYRISFLKGLFSGEGHVKHSVYGTIESIGFSFNPKTEKSLSEFVRRCLELERIKSKIDNTRGYLYFCGYENMLRFFGLGIVDLHNDKKEKFMKLIKNSVIHVHLDKGILDKIDKFSQLELSRKIGVSQPLISRWKKDNCIGLDELIRIFPILEISREDFVKKIKFLKITNSYVKDRESINFILSIYNFEDKPFKIDVYRNRKRSNKSSLFSILKDVMETSRHEDIYLNSISKRSHLNKITIQQKLRMLEINGYLEYIGMKGLSKVYEITEKGKLEYQNLQGLYKIKQI